MKMANDLTGRHWIKASNQTCCGMNSCHKALHDAKFLMDNLHTVVNKLVVWKGRKYEPQEPFIVIVKNCCWQKLDTGKMKAIRKMTLASGARQFVVQLALETTFIFGS